MEIQGADQKDPVVVRRDAITKLEVSLGRRSRGRGAGIGALVGFGIGVLPAFVPEPEGPTVVSHKAVGLFVGAIGAGVGALIGAAIPPGEKWRPVPTGLRVSVSGTRSRDVGVSWSFEF